MRSARTGPGAAPISTVTASPVRLRRHRYRQRVGGVDRRLDRCALRADDDVGAVHHQRRREHAAAKLRAHRPAGGRSRCGWRTGRASRDGPSSRRARPARSPSGRRASWPSSASAGGQDEQPCEVNSSRTTGFVAACAGGRRGDATPAIRSRRRMVASIGRFAGWTLAGSR